MRSVLKRKRKELIMHIREPDGKWFLPELKKYCIVTAEAEQSVRFIYYATERL